MRTALRARGALPSLALVLAACLAGGCAATPPPPSTSPPTPATPLPPAPRPSPLGAPLPSFTGSVAGIETRGASSTEEILRRTLVTHVGERFDATRIQEDLRALWALRRFEDVAVEGERRSEGVVLTYVVVERPPIERVSIVGLKQIPEPELSSLVAELRGSPADPAHIDAAVRRVRAQCVEIGFRLARVETEIDRVAQGPVELRFLVDEGPLVRIGTWTFTGNVAVSEAELRAQMKSTPHNAAGSLYDEERWERDVMILSSYYFDRGMLQVSVGPAVVTPSADGSTLAVNVPIVEGSVFHLGKIAVVDASAKGTPKAAAGPTGALRIKRGEVFSRARLVEDIERLRAFFAKRKRRVEVSPTTEIDVPGARVDLVFHVADAAP
jgi:outer membrane protein insertion porin family